MVHEDVLCRSSSFLEAACDEKWNNSNAKVITLPDVSPDTFLLYVDWLYNGPLDLDEGYVYLNEPSMPALCEILDQALSAYVLGQFLQDITFSNELIDAILTNLIVGGATFSAVDVTTYWPSLPRQSGFLMIEHVAVHEDFDSIYEYPSDFVSCVAEVCMRDRTETLEDRDPELKEVVYYHDRPSRLHLRRTI